MAKKAKKQRKKLNFSKAKQTIANIFKTCGRISIATLGIASLAAFIVIPFLHNSIDRTWAQWIWYPACAIFVVSAILDFNSPNKKPSKIPLFDFFEKLSLLPAILIFGSAFIINYYNVAFSWWWAGFIIFAVYFPLFIFGIRKYLEKEKNYTTDQIKKSKKNCWKYVLFYWLIDLFYMSIFNYCQVVEQLKTPWFVLQFVFGGLAMVYIFYNLTKVFLANGEKHWWGLLQDFVLGILITIYLIFLLPNDSGLQTIAATIIAAVYGGLLTLVGVAWTIKDADAKRKEDLDRVEKERKEDWQRIEDQRREDERKKFRPIVNVFAGTCINEEYETIRASWLKDTSGISKNATEELKVVNKIQNPFFRNTDFSNVYVWGIKINGNLTHFRSIRYIRKEGYFCIDFSNVFIHTKEPIKTISLVLEDLLENLYELPLEFTLSQPHNWYIIQGNQPSFHIGNAKKERNNE